MILQLVHLCDQCTKTVLALVLKHVELHTSLSTGKVFSSTRQCSGLHFTLN